MKVGYEASRLKTSQQNDMPLISVITVCFNSQRTILETLQSVASQDFASYEHIVWDGGSTDGTRDIVSSFSNPSLRCLYGSDSGIYDAMTQAAAHASGDYIMFLNSDDVLTTSGSLSSVATAAKGQADLVCWDIAYFGDSGSLVRSGVWQSSRRYPRAARFSVVPPHPGTAVKREVFVRLGGFSTAYRTAGDFDFFLRLSKLNPSVTFIPKVLVCMRMGGASTRSLRQIWLGLSESMKSAHAAFGLMSVFALFKPLHKLGQFSVTSARKSS